MVAPNGTYIVRSVKTDCEMKKLLYIAPCEFNYDSPNGVGKKVLNHYKVFSMFYESYLIYYEGEAVSFVTRAKRGAVEMKRNMSRRTAFFNYATKVIVEKGVFENVYIRFSATDFNVIRLLKCIKKTLPNAKVVIEIPTYPYNQTYGLSIRTIVKRVFDYFLSGCLQNYVSRVVTYSPDKEIWNIPTINTMNGVSFKDIPISNKTSIDPNEIHLISVSMTYPCHGYDRVIEGMKKYSGVRKIIYHIVGTGSEISKYQKMIADYHLSDCVILHGFLSGEKLETVYNQADIAINSLAIHRIGLVTESTLKSKEYAAKGLPMISSYQVDALDDSCGNQYVMQVPLDESAIEMDRVIDFCDKVYTKGVTRVHKIIRDCAYNRCDMEKTLQPIISYFNSDNEN